MVAVTGALVGGAQVEVVGGAPVDPVAAAQDLPQDLLLVMVEHHVVKPHLQIL